MFYNDGGNAVPADGTATYSIRAKVKLTGRGQPYLRLSLAHFDDTNPTEDPSTTGVGSVDLPIEVSGDGSWRQIEIPVSEDILTTDGGTRANVVLMYARFSPPESGDSAFELDEFEFIEWRPASTMPDRFLGVDYLRNTRSSSTSVTLPTMTLQEE
jgi:hypothetical protein